jgi:ferredoxin
VIAEPQRDTPSGSKLPAPSSKLQAPPDTLALTMAELRDRYPENVPGKFYVDSSCIDCDVCRDTAPDNFTRNDDGGYSFVFEQPSTPEEAELCQEALECCPVEAIGCDGE